MRSGGLRAAAFYWLLAFGGWLSRLAEGKAGGFHTAGGMHNACCRPLRYAPKPLRKRSATDHKKAATGSRLNQESHDFLLPGLAIA
jgi:hypothetical protein